MRVVLSDETEIVAHDCEMKMRLNATMVSWAGDLEAFFQMFQPFPQDQYPKTAQP